MSSLEFVSAVLIFLAPLMPNFWLRRCLLPHLDPGVHGLLEYLATHTALSMHNTFILASSTCLQRQGRSTLCHTAQHASDGTSFGSAGHVWKRWHSRSCLLSSVSCSQLLADTATTTYDSKNQKCT